MRNLTPKDLEPGMITADIVKTPLGQVLAPAGAEITRQLINRMKLYRVETIAIEGDAPDEENTEIKEEIKAEPVSAVKETVKEEPAASSKTHIEKTKTHSQKVAESDSFKSFQINYYKAIQTLKDQFKGAIEERKEIDTDLLLESVRGLYTGQGTIIEIFDMLHNLRGIADSTYSHSISVALTARMIGRWLKFDRHDLDILTLCGLLHDIGKARIPDEILNKPGKLTDEEFELVKQHPKLGYDILKNQNLDSHIKKSALMHHERCDGSGYPLGLTEDALDEFAMIISIADVYDAMTAARAHRSPLCPFQVIANFENEGFQKYHPKYILIFLQQIAKTYQSNRMILSDGRGCNIVMLNNRALSRPMVQLDDNTVLDLSTNRDLYIKAVT